MLRLDEGERLALAVVEAEAAEVEEVGEVRLWSSTNWERSGWRWFCCVRCLLGWRWAGGGVSVFAVAVAVAGAVAVVMLAVVAGVGW